MSAHLVLPLAISITDLGDPLALLSHAGPWILAVVAVIVFIESGVLFPFLPGDSLVFTAGVAHGQLGIPLAVMIAVIVAAAILGDQAGYWIGRRFGAAAFSEDAKFLKLRYLRRAEKFFTDYGGRSLVLARFVPLARTFVPVVAGAAHYPYRIFFRWNILGGILWGTLLCVAGALLGEIPFVADHVDLIVVGIVMLSIIPTASEIFRQIRRGRAAAGS